MEVLLVIDMQEGMLRGEPKHDLAAVVARIDALASGVRRRGGRVVFVAHDGTEADGFAPFSPGWSILAGLHREAKDEVVRKTRNDAFFETPLGEKLRALEARPLIVAGWATDLCVDSTVRSAAARGYEVVIAADAHTVSDRPHLPAERVIEHHHWVWQNLIATHPVALARAEELAGAVV